VSGDIIIGYSTVIASKLGSYTTGTKNPPQEAGFLVG
jgi:hypothetical protein